MRLCRFEPNRLGVVEGDKVADSRMRCRFSRPSVIRFPITT